MKAISLHQPWATLLSSGAKRIETRDWQPRGLRPGQLVAIHAAKHWTDDQRELIADDPFFKRHLALAQRRGLWSFTHPPLGGVVAIARFLGAFPTERLRNNITMTEQAFGNYGPGRYGWFFSEVRPLAIIPARGQQAIFDWEPLRASEMEALYIEAVNQPRLGGRMADLLLELAESLRYPTACVEGVAHKPEPALPPSPPSLPAEWTTRVGCVVHCRKEAFDVYVGRQMARYPDLKATGWGNPYKDGIDTQAGRQSAIDRYREWVLTQPRLLARLSELRGKRLGCWCAPAGGLPGNLYGHVCHGEVLATLADRWCAQCNSLESPEHVREHEAAAEIAMGQTLGALTGSGQFREVREARMR